MAVFRTQQTKAGRRTQAIVRKGGFSLSRVFWRTGEAQAWARRVEDAIASATPATPFTREAWLHELLAPQAVDESRPHRGWTLAMALRHYAATLTPQKKGAGQERKRLAAWCSHALAGKRMDAVTTAELQDYVDARLRAGRSASTVRLDVMALRAVYRDAVALWKVAGLANPAVGVRLPGAAPHRQRRLEDGHGPGDDGEERRLRAALAGAAGGADLSDLLDLALETGMRQSEILSMTPGQLRRAGGARFIEQPDSKNGQPRRVTLSTTAVAIVERRSVGKAPSARLFAVSSGTLWKQWNALRARAGVTGFRWHDLRHEALSRMAGKGLNIGELQAQSGHRTPGILLRYVNAKPQDVAKKLG